MILFRIFPLSGCLFGLERLLQLGAVAVTGKEKKHRPLCPGAAEHVRPEGDSHERIGHLWEETQRLCFQQPGLN